MAPDDELEPGDDSDEARAKDMARGLRDAADTLERIPELYIPFQRGDISFEELMDQLMYYDEDEAESMSELIEQYGPPPGEPPHEP